MLSELCLKPARDTSEKLKNSSRRFQAEPRWIAVAAASRQLGLEGAHHPIALRQIVFSGESWRGAPVGHSWLSRWVVLGRVPKARFDIWGLRPGLYFDLENYDVAVPECGIEVIGVTMGAANF
jgi:hypothetical protein